MKNILLGFRLISIALFVVCAYPASGRAVNPVSLRLAIWCEFLPYARVIETLPLLARYQCELFIHVEPKDIAHPDLEKLCLEARKQGVSIGAWTLLPYEEHLYTGEQSLAAARRLTRAIVSWNHAARLGIRTIIFDCEPSPLLGRKLFEHVRTRRPGELVQTLRDEMNPVAFDTSVVELNALVTELRHQGFEVMGAGNRVFLDFLRHGNTSIQDALNAPFTMVHWDRISFLVYRYRASQEDYLTMINRYGQLAQRYFPGRAGLDIGLTGSHRHIPENTQRAQLFGGGEAFLDYLDGILAPRDIRAAVAMGMSRGIRDINLYSLDGALDSPPGLENWLKAARAGEEDARQSLRYTWSPLRSMSLGLLGRTLPWFFERLVVNSKPTRQEPQPAP